MAAHFTDTFFDDALNGSAPACVEDSNDAATQIDGNDGKTVGDLDGDDDAGEVGDESVAGVDGFGF